MVRKQVKKNGRDKKFIGAIIGTVAGLAGSLIGAKKQRKADEEAFQAQQAEQNRIDSVKAAQNLTSSYADQSYVDDYKKKIVLKAGGKVSTKDKVRNYTVGKKKSDIEAYKAGGRAKYVDGGTTDESSSDSIDFGAEATDAIGGLTSLATNLFTKPKVNKMIKKADGFAFTPSTATVAPQSYQLDINGQPITTVNPVSPMIKPDVNAPAIAKMGTKKVSKKLW